MPDTFHRTDYPTSNNELSKSLWSTRPGIMDHYNQLMQSESSNMHSINANSDVSLSSGIHWRHYAEQIISMFRSIWNANMECLVNNIKYVCDDGYEYQQPSESYKSDQSNESEFGYIQEYNPNGCATCGCSTKPCYCEYPIKLNNNEYNEHKLK